jgi:hypothetical protein
VERWLRDHFATPYPVAVLYVPRQSKHLRPGDHREIVEAITYRRGNRIEIAISLAIPWGHAIHALLHEWAHAVDWRPERLDKEREAHPDEWGIAYARIYREFYDNKGWEASELYPLENE